MCISRFPGSATPGDTSTIACAQCHCQHFWKHFRRFPNSGDSPRLFQLYWPNDPELAESFVDRAEAAGYEAIVVTVDNAFPGWKPRDLQNAYLPAIEGIGLANFFADPVFRAGLERTPEEDPGPAIGKFIGVFGNPSLTWDDLEWLRARTSVPILLKGILHPDDAREARERGVDGVVVSNHAAARSTAPSRRSMPCRRSRLPSART